MLGSESSHAAHLRKNVRLWVSQQHPLGYPKEHRERISTSSSHETPWRVRTAFLLTSKYVFSEYMSVRTTKSISSGIVIPFQSTNTAWAMWGTDGIVGNMHMCKQKITFSIGKVANAYASVEF